MSGSPGELGEHTQAKPLSTSSGSQMILRCTQVGKPLGSELVPVGGSGMIGAQGQLTNPRLLGSRARKENKNFCVGFVTLKLYLLHHYVRPSHPISWYCLHSTDEETFKGRKQLAQCHMGFEPQICLPPDSGCGWSWFFFCYLNYYQEHQRGHLYLNSDDALIVS